MAAPFKNIDRNTDESNQRSSGWLVGIVRYTDIASMSGKETFSTVVEVIQNDAVSVTISNDKSSFGKTANIGLKSTDFYYPSKVSSGDWIFIWMHDNEADTARVIKLLNIIQADGKVGAGLCDEFSGLKFAGRCIGVSHSDTIASSGMRVINQSISAQAFLEFATSVYYTAALKAVVAGPTPGASGGTDTSAVTSALTETVQFDRLSGTLKDLAESYKKFHMQGKQEYSPDVIISLFYILIMGIEKDKYADTLGVAGTFNNGIHVPRQVANIFNKPGATKIWQIMNIFLGIQRYENTSNKWYKSFQPKLESNDADVFRRTPARCKGFVPFAPTLWDNISMWSILSSYVNPVSNEMYTCMRINEAGNIMPTLVVREKPFSTGLFNSLKEHSNAVGKVNIPPAKNVTEPVSSGNGIKLSSFSLPSVGVASAAESASDNLFTTASTSAASFTMYGTIPRWKISEAVVRSFQWSTNEAARINFVQVWGANASAQLTGSKLDQATYTQQQFVNGNYYTDQNDISRNGLRAHIINSPFDTYYGASDGSFASLWARMNADWLFNGHLKANGTLTTDGIVEPICEGDNLEYRGILFHIDSVSHSASISQGGLKTWTTTLRLSNGMMAASFNNLKSVPQYPAFINITRDKFKTPDAPGLTEVQVRIGDKTKNPLGDSMKKLGIDQ